MANNFTFRGNPRLGKRERLAVSSSAVGFAFANNFLTNFSNVGTERNPPKVCSGAILQVGNDSIYWTTDGTTPTAVIGFTNDPGDFIYLDTYQKVRAFKALRVTADTFIEAQALFE